MKKMMIMLGLASLLTGAAQAQLIMYESFGTIKGNDGDVFYTNKPAANTNWVTGFTTGQQAKQYAGDLSYPGFAESSGGKVSLGQQTDTDRGMLTKNTGISSGSLYYSFLLNVDSATGLLAAFGDGNGTMMSSRDTEGSNKLQVISDGAGGFKLGIDGTGGIYGSTGSYALDTTYLIVVGISDVTTASTLSLWVNPLLGGASQGVATVTDTARANSAAGTKSLLVVGNAGTTANGGTLQNVYVDELRLGTTWASVTPQGGVVYNLTVNANPGGSATGGGSYAAGLNPQITATVSNGFVFVNWTGDVFSVNSTTNVLMDSNKTVWANFGPEPVKATTFVIE